MSNVNTHVHMMLPFKREGYLVDKKALVVDLEEGFVISLNQYLCGERLEQVQLCKLRCCPQASTD